MRVNIHDLPSTEVNMDMTGSPVHQCVCGCPVFKILASFEDYEISTYFTEGECVDCGTRVTVPTPIDKPGYKPDSLAF